MPTAPSPTPQYISLTNVESYLNNGLQGKVLFSDTNPNGIATVLANELIAEGETLALFDISPYYVTVPNLITTTGQVWTELPYYTYTTLYYMFVIQSALNIIGNFIARNTDHADTTLSYFQNFYTNEYKKYISRVMDRLPNGSYKYQLIGLQPLNTGIERTQQTYASSGRLGSGNYAERQFINPSRNFQQWWGGCWWNR